MVSGAKGTRGVGVSQLIQKAFRWQQQGKLDAAAEAFGAVLSVEPHHFEAHRQLGILRFQQGRHVEALPHLAMAAKLKPRDVAAASNHGLALATLGRLDEALAAYERALEIRPDHAETHFNRANALRDLGSFAEALAGYDRAIAARPALFEAWNNRGNLLKALGRPAEATASFDKALAIKPRHVGALYNRANALRDLNRNAEALADFDKAIAITPNYLEAHVNRGHALKDLDRPGDALASYQRALTLNPDCAEAHDGRGLVLIELGRLEEARAEFETAVRIAPRKASFYFNLTCARKMNAGESAVRAMEDLWRDRFALDPDEEIPLRFALAKTYADFGDSERAFLRLLEGNALKRRQIAYDERSTLEALAITRETFSADFLRAHGGLGDPSCIPVFIIGMPRSGGTLAEQILASCPNACGAGEILDFADAVSEVGAGWSAAQALHGDARACAASLREIGARYVERIRRLAPKAERIVNKLPDNFRWAGLIHLALPNARIVHTRRDPIDTSVSCFAKLFSGHLPYCYDLGELGRYYCAYDELMAHWRAALPHQTLLEVQYEDLVEDFEPQARRLVAHCGLAWDPRCLRFFETERAVRTASAAQVRQPVYTTSVGAWRRYERYLGPLLKSLEPALTRSAPEAEAGLARRNGALAGLLRATASLANAARAGFAGASASGRRRQAS